MGKFIVLLILAVAVSAAHQRVWEAVPRHWAPWEPLALAWVIYGRQRLQPAAEAVFGSRLVSVEHYGSYSCRNVYGRASGRLSEHATAEALDVAAFGLADGRRITLLRDWADEGEAGDFLREAREGACDIFGNVLGPDYNAAHANHFHFGMRGFRLCR